MNELMKNLEELMAKYELDTHDIYCLLGIGASRAAEFSAIDYNVDLARKFSALSTELDTILYHKTFGGR